MAVITISRSYGSGGNEIAARVCELLGYRYFDKHLLAELAAEMGFAEGRVVDYSEEKYKARGLVERLLSGMGVGRVQSRTQEAPDPRQDPDAFLDEAASQALVQATVKAACDLGDIVIVGRGGSVVLGNAPGVLHVFVDAPLEDRVRRVARREHIDEATARDDWIAVRDRAAADYMRRYHGVTWSDPLLYHVVINTGMLHIESAARLVVAALDCLPAVSA